MLTEVRAIIERETPRYADDAWWRGFESACVKLDNYIEDLADRIEDQSLLDDANGQYSSVQEAEIDR